MILAGGTEFPAVPFLISLSDCLELIEAEHIAQVAIANIIKSGVDKINQASYVLVSLLICVGCGIDGIIEVVRSILCTQLMTCCAIKTD